MLFLAKKNESGTRPLGDNVVGMGEPGLPQEKLSRGTTPQFGGFCGVFGFLRCLLETCFVCACLGAVRREFRSGALDRDRTCALPITSRVLYQLSYKGEIAQNVNVARFVPWSQGDLNP